MAKSKTRQYIGIPLIIASLCSLYFVPWLILKAWIMPLPNTVQEQMEDALDYGFEGIITYVDLGEKKHQSFAAGWHNREEKIPAKADALYKIASIAKLFEAVAITKLAAEDQILLDAPLVEYLPELEGRIANANQATIRHLVQHRSGIPNYSDTPGYWSNPPKSFQGHLELVIDKPANFAAGEDYEYCNTNYLLLQRIMDKLLGEPNFEYKRQKILLPLEMENTYASTKDAPMEELMSGYHIGYPDDLKEADFGMIASAQDVAKFVRALNDGSLLNEYEQEIYASLYKYEHSGWVPGYQSFVEYHEDIDAVFVHFYNTTDSELYNWNLSEVFNSRMVKIWKENWSEKN